MTPIIHKYAIKYIGLMRKHFRNNMQPRLMKYLYPVLSYRAKHVQKLGKNGAPFMVTLDQLTPVNRVNE